MNALAMAFFLLAAQTAEDRTRPVTVIGAVNRDAVFMAQGRMTMGDALDRAGGLAPRAAGEIEWSHPLRDGRRGLIHRLRVSAAREIRLTGGEDIRVR